MTGINRVRSNLPGLREKRLGKVCALPPDPGVGGWLSSLQDQGSAFKTQGQDWKGSFLIGSEGGKGHGKQIWQVDRGPIGIGGSRQEGNPPQHKRMRSEGGEARVQPLQP